MTRATALLVTFAAAVAAADERPPADADRAPRRDAAEVAREGTFLPFTLSGRIGDQRVSAVALGGYDTSDAEGPIATAVVEGALFNRVALRVGIDYLAPTNAVSPSVGLRAGILRQEQFGVDVGFAIVYKQRGYTESSGEFELAFTIDHRWRKLGLFGNLVFGTGIDPRERDGEVRAAVIWFAHERVNVGLDARARFDLGGDTPGREKNKLESDFDLVAGPLVSVAVSHVVFLAQAGVHSRLQQDTAYTGFVAQGGLGLAF
jgi:hypothetical protein